MAHSNCGHWGFCIFRSSWVCRSRSNSSRPLGVAHWSCHAVCEPDSFDRKPCVFLFYHHLRLRFNADKQWMTSECWPIDHSDQDAKRHILIISNNMLPKLWNPIPLMLLEWPDRSGPKVPNVPLVPRQDLELSTHAPSDAMEVILNGDLESHQAMETWTWESVFLHYPISFLIPII